MNSFFLLSILNEPAAVYTLVLLVTFIEAIFPVGLFLPGTTLLLFVGYLCSNGTISILPTTLILVFSGTAGGVTSFFIGKFGKEHLRFLKNRHTEHRLHKAEKFFDKYGVAGVAVHRFLGPLRSILPFTAGFLKMRFQTFLPISLFSNLISSIIYVLAGSYFGGNADQILHFIQRYEKIIFTWF